MKGETGAMYQIVGRHYEPWVKEAPAKPLLEVSVDYDRTRLSTSDLLEATATLKYNGTEPTAMVMLDLGMPPGFTADAGDFAEMVGAKKVQKFSLTERQAIAVPGRRGAGPGVPVQVHVAAEVPGEGQDAGRARRMSTTRRQHRAARRRWN